MSCLLQLFKSVIIGRVYCLLLALFLVTVLFFIDISFNEQVRHYDLTSPLTTVCFRLPNEDQMRISCSHSRTLLLAWSLEPENSTASHLWCENFTGYQSGKGSDLKQPFKCLHGLAPEYLYEYCKLTTGRSHLRSANACLLSVPRTRTTYGDRSFAASGPLAWNSLPVALRSSDVTEETFRRHLKTFLFNCLDN